MFKSNLDENYICLCLIYTTYQMYNDRKPTSPKLKKNTNLDS